MLSWDKMTPAVRELFEIRANSYFDTNIVSLGVLSSICEALDKYDLFNDFDSWYHDSSLGTYASWKTTVKRKIWEFEGNSWNSFVLDHPNLSLAQACLATMSPHMFWSISDQYPGLVYRLHVQIRLMGNFALNGGIPWVTNTDDSLCFVYKRDTETLGHFLFDCHDFREHFDSLWSDLCLKVAAASNPLDGGHIVGFLMSPDRHHKAMLLPGCLPQRLEKFINYAEKDCMSWGLRG